MCLFFNFSRHIHCQCEYTFGSAQTAAWRRRRTPPRRWSWWPLPKCYSGSPGTKLGQTAPHSLSGTRRSLPVWDQAKRRGARALWRPWRQANFSQRRHHAQVHCLRERTSLASPFQASSSSDAPITCPGLPRWTWRWWVRPWAWCGCISALCCQRTPRSLGLLADMHSCHDRAWFPFFQPLFSLLLLSGV
jgi:hypothetical protein